MGKYSIKELEQLSGIKAHTIRIWEKRHRLVEPKRTPTNIRYYSDEDLKKIINVSLLNTHGVKISKIVDLSAEEINQKVAELSEAKDSIEIYIDQLVLAMIDMEEEQFEKILANLILKFGFERTIIEIVYPFLEKIGVLWLTNNISPAQEHFISHLIRQKLIVAIDGIPLAPKTSKRVLLYLPENELHELGLLFYHYICKHAGFRTYYLGQSVPYNDLKSVVEAHLPNIIVSSFTTVPQANSVDAYLNRLATDFSEMTILVSGYVLKKLKSSPKSNVHLFSKALEIKDLLINLK
jgi:MerR family transcriptional regulator, light-induced transcriptional regulator